ncbi:MAG: hypothetical protein ABIA62_01005 [Candidatus Woesearchaeota archaeon]
MSRLAGVSGLRKVGHSNSRTCRSRKGQVTIFMIIGIVLLFGSAIIFYIRGQVTQGTEGGFAPIIEEVPLEAQPLKIFVENCLKQKGTSGIERIGLHGGYIDPTDEDMSGKVFFSGLDPTDSDALSMFGDKGLMPYWWYLKSDNTCSETCKFDSNAPALRKGMEPSIEGQMDKYIENTLGSCINEFRDFRMQGFEIEIRGDMKSDVNIAEEEILLFLDYPITVIKGDSRIDIDRFFTKLDINFMDIYNLAADLVEHESVTYYLEVQAMNLISMYSQPADANKIPPISDITIGLGDYKMWTRLETKSKIESYVLGPGISMLQVMNTLNFQPRVMFKTGADGAQEVDPIAQGIMDRTIIELDNPINYTEIAVDFTYLDWWPIYLNINDQEVIGPTSMQGASLLSFFAVNQYTSWYDVSFPVMVTLTDYDALQGKGYKFNFALEGNIRDNNHTSSQYVSLARDSNQKLSCNLDQRDAGPVTIETLNSLTGEPVTARVDYVFGAQSCFVGFTKLTELDGKNRSMLTAMFPSGFGELRVNNESFLLHQNREIMREEEETNLTIKLIPYRFINASVFVLDILYDPVAKNYAVPGASVPGPMSPLNEQAFLMFERIDDEVLTDFNTFLGLKGGTDSDIIRLVPGKYEVRGYLMYENEMTPIRVQKETIHYDGILGFGGQDIELNETILNPYPKGGVTFNNDTGYLEITNDQLFGNDKVIFYVLRFAPPKTHSESLKNLPGLEQLSYLEKYSGIYRDRLEPRFIGLEGD